MWYSGVFGVADYESELNVQKLKMADQNVKTYLFGIIFGTRAILRSLIMNPSLTFGNSNSNFASPIFNPPIWISECWAQIRNQPKASEYQILYQSSIFLNFGPPCCMRYFEFLNFELEFVISDLKNSRLPIVIPIKEVFALWSAVWNRHFEFLIFELGFVISAPKNPRVPNFIWIFFFLFSPPYYTRHFKFINFELEFVISYLKNLQVRTFKCIETKEEFMLVKKWPKFEPQYRQTISVLWYRGRHFEFWNFYFRFGFSELKYEFETYPIIINAFLLNSLETLAYHSLPKYWTRKTKKSLKKYVTTSPGLRYALQWIVCCGCTSKCWGDKYFSSIVGSTPSGNGRCKSCAGG